MAVSAVGHDELGEETLEALNEKQLNFCMPRVDYPTGTVQVTLDDEGGADLCDSRGGGLGQYSFYCRIGGSGAPHQCGVFRIACAAQPRIASYNTGLLEGAARKCVENF